MQCEGIEEESEGISLSIPLSPIARAQAAARAPSYLPPSAPEVVSLSSPLFRTFAECALE